MGDSETLKFFLALCMCLFYAIYEAVREPSMIGVILIPNIFYTIYKILQQGRQIFSGISSYHDIVVVSATLSVCVHYTLQVTFRHMSILYVILLTSLCDMAYFTMAEKGKVILLPPPSKWENLLEARSIPLTIIASVTFTFTETLNQVSLSFYGTVAALALLLEAMEIISIIVIAVCERKVQDKEIRLYAFVFLIAAYFTAFTTYRMMATKLVISIPLLLHIGNSCVSVTRTVISKGGKQTVLALVDLIQGFPFRSLIIPFSSLYIGYVSHNEEKMLYALFLSLFLWIGYFIYLLPKQSEKQQLWWEEEEEKARFNDLTSQNAKAKKILKERAENWEVECRICMDNAKKIADTGRSLKCTPCGHIYCNVCIDKALELNQSCPTCNAELSSRKLHQIFV